MLHGLFSSLWLTMIISSGYHISAITVAMSGILGEGVWSNTAPNSWQRRHTVAEAHVQGAIELRYTDKEWFFSRSLRVSETKLLRFVFSCCTVTTWRAIFMAESANRSFVWRGGCNKNKSRIQETLPAQTCSVLTHADRVRCCCVVKHVWPFLKKLFICLELITNNDTNNHFFFVYWLSVESYYFTKYKLEKYYLLMTVSGSL